MSAVCPVTKQAWMLLFMAFQAGHGLRRHAALDPELFDFRKITGCLSVGYNGSRYQKPCKSDDQSSNTQKLFHSQPPFLKSELLPVISKYSLKTRSYVY
jgi:hypothetical protein